MGGHPCGGRHRPCATAPTPPPLLVVGQAAGDSPLRAPCSRPLGGRRAASGCCPCGLLLLRVIAPCGLALAAASRPLTRGLGHGLAVGGRPCMGAGRGCPPFLLAAFAMKNIARTRRSYIPVFQIRMEKMKEVKHPSL
ncbi:hypothetical protein BHE74_00039309 [Ensete ventricosum]|nr:hypothetical protein BHE74_00039309 [Ensete ventricosum]